MDCRNGLQKDGHLDVMKDDYTRIVLKAAAAAAAAGTTRTFFSRIITHFDAD